MLKICYEWQFNRTTDCRVESMNKKVEEVGADLLAAQALYARILTKFTYLYIITYILIYRRRFDDGWKDLSEMRATDALE